MGYTHRYKNGIKIDLTAEEIAAIRDQDIITANAAPAVALEELRNKRNRRLAETDWMANSDVTMSDNWKTYRQALRDLPSGKDTVEKCENATWPEKP